MSIIITDEDQLKNLERFVNDFSVFLATNKSKRLNLFKNGFETLSSGLMAVSERAKEADKKFASKFNLFRLLQVERNEVYTHSAILADLLNPSGSHGQGSLFISNFFKMLKNKNPGNFSINELSPASFRYPQSWRVEKEKATAFGRLDIAISSIDRKILVVIENKIDAMEQSDQLKRYENWMESQRKRFTTQVLCYLTKYGYDSNTSFGGSYIKLSYKDDIFNWLTESAPLVGATTVKEVLKQYLTVIENL